MKCCSEFFLLLFLFSSKPIEVTQAQGMLEHYEFVFGSGKVSFLGGLFLRKHCLLRSLYTQPNNCIYNFLTIRSIITEP